MAHISYHTALFNTVVPAAPRYFEFRRFNPYIFLSAALFFVLAIYCVLALQTLSLKSALLENQRAVRVLSTSTTELEAMLYEKISPELLIEKARLLELVDVQTASYLSAPMIPASARR